jgi:hypothetical protein
MGIEATQWGRPHTATGRELLRCLEAQARLLIGADIAELHAIGVPLVKLPFVYQAWRSIPELAVDPRFPQVLRFDDVGIR